MIIICRQRESLKSQQTKKDLNSILTEWKFNDQPLKNSQEFLAKFKPWINEQLAAKRKLKTFLESKGVNNLEELE